MDDQNLSDDEMDLLERYRQLTGADRADIDAAMRYYAEIESGE